MSKLAIPRDQPRARPGRQPAALPHRPPARALAFCAKVLDLFFGEVLDPDETVLCLARADNFIELDLNGGVVAVLSSESRTPSGT
jgi:hypothetical protein